MNSHKEVEMPAHIYAWMSVVLAVCVCVCIMVFIAYVNLYSMILLKHVVSD